MADFDVLDVSRALQPLYGPRAHPDELARLAAERLTALLGAQVRLEMPEALGVRPQGAESAAGTWALEFQYDGVAGRLVGSGTEPAEAARAALRLELERLCAYVGLLRGIGAVFDRLEFRLQALHQIARTLTVARETAETESVIADFTRELFFSWWVALYRPRGDAWMEARVVHTLRGQSAPSQLRADDLAELAPVGTESRAVSVTERPHWLPTEVRALAPLDVGRVRVGCLMLGERMNEEPYREDDLQLLGTLAHASAIAIRNAELLERLREQTILDDLTGLYNRRYFDQKLPLEFARARRYGRPLSLILLDVDHFKAYNDDFGHTAGDVVLARIGALLRADIRSVDVGCRYGGEEFAVIVPDTAPAGARRLAERLHGAVSGMEATAGLRRPITVSIGVASFPENATEPHEVVEAADRALYRAKAEGRNRIVAA